MKNIALVIVNAVLGVLTLMIAMTVYGRMNRSMELQSSLPSAAEQAIDNLMLSHKYSIDDTDEFLADLTEELAVTVDSESGIGIEILQCDREKGILSVKVTASYLHPNGKEGDVECTRCVILDRMQEEEPAKTYTVTFIVGEERYKEYRVLDGCSINEPAAPQGVSGTFHGWADSSGNMADFSVPVTQDMAYYADLR